ncbi:uncharacterized protein C12orf31 homolog [Orussus abietinus]|uniref:uncharacterized protein C12orf31 homolog n=1 Tax=Orussus abietinus TaxID=222816 RepID=UPI000626ACC9|nr:uncharacterized protein C12orf31 homolog [Orussus abietinus]
MAKSIRSKWRRKCKAVKRERYGAKELERLKKTLGLDGNSTGDVEMAELSKIATVIDPKSVNDAAETNDVPATTEEKMEEDGKRVYNKKTMRDQYGNYPIWMNRRKIAKHKKGRAKTKKATTKQVKRLTRKQKKQVPSGEQE